MKKILIVISLVTLSSCSDDEGPIRYVPINDGDVIDKEWFQRTYGNIKEYYYRIGQAKGYLDFEENAYDWNVATPWSIGLSARYDMCLNTTNGYNYEALNYDQATFDMWKLPKYIPFKDCY